MTDIERRPYEAIQELLTGFRAHTVRLGDLLEELPDRLKMIPDPDPEWKEECVSCWWTLEQIHGQAIDLGESRRMPLESRQAVDDTIDELERLVATALQTHA